MKNEGKSFPTFKEFYTEQSTVSKIGQGVGKAVGSVAAAPFKLAGGLLKGIGSAFKRKPSTSAAAPTPKPAAVTTPAAAPTPKPAANKISSANIRGEAPGAQASLDDVYGKQAVDPMKGATAYKPIRPTTTSASTASTTPAVDPFADEKPKTTTTAPKPATAATAPTTPTSTTAPIGPAKPNYKDRTDPLTQNIADTSELKTTPGAYDNTKEIPAYGAKEPSTAPTTPTSPSTAPTTPGAPPPKGMGLNPDAKAGTITVGGTGRFTGVQNAYINPDKTTAMDMEGNKFIRDTINSPWRRMKQEEDTGVKEVDQLPSVS